MSKDHHPLMVFMTEVGTRGAWPVTDSREHAGNYEDWMKHEGDAMLLKAIFIYWPLLSILIATVLCRLIHNAKLTDRALEKRP